MPRLAEKEHRVVKSDQYQKISQKTRRGNIHNVLEGLSTGPVWPYSGDYYGTSTATYLLPQFPPKKPCIFEISKIVDGTLPFTRLNFGKSLPLFTSLPSFFKQFVERGLVKVTSQLKWKDKKNRQSVVWKILKFTTCGGTGATRGAETKMWCKICPKKR
jgi:hypothetical protein